MVDLSGTAGKLMKAGKGILAADESVHSADARLKQYGIAQGPEMRRKYRDLFLDAPHIEDYLSGVILFTETLEQKGGDGKLFPKSLNARGILPGIKVDLGTEPLPESPKELVTTGLIGLTERLDAYAKEGAEFTKWRAVVKIDGDRLPSAQCLVENAKRLASYACDAQRSGLVPMIEPEVLFEGKHSRLRARNVIAETLSIVIEACKDQAVDLTGILIKTSMALSGSESGKTDAPEEVAEATLEALIKSVPKNIPGIVFLSGGQSAEQATANLGAIVERAKSAGAPWPFTFSFARALQDEALTKWQGKEENVPEAREVFLRRLKSVSAALGVAEYLDKERAFRYSALHDKSCRN